MIDDNNDHRINFVSADEKIRQEAWTREKTLNDYYSDMFNAREEGIQEGIENERLKIIETMKKLGYSQARIWIKCLENNFGHLWNKNILKYREL